MSVFNQFKFFESLNSAPVISTKVEDKLARTSQGVSSIAPMLLKSISSSTFSLLGLLPELFVPLELPDLDFLDFTKDFKTFFKEQLTPYYKSLTPRSLKSFSMDSRISQGLGFGNYKKDSEFKTRVNRDSKFYLEFPLYKLVCKRLAHKISSESSSISPVSSLIKLF